MPRYREEEREKAAAETRYKLVQSAIAEFSEKGYANANIDRISKTAGFAKGTIYNYFASKHELMLALISEIAAFHQEYLQAQVLQEPGPISRLERFFSAGFEFVEAYPAEARFLIISLYGAAREFNAAMFKAYQPMFALIGEILSDGMAEGVFKREDVSSKAALLLTIYLGACSQTDENGQVYMQAADVSNFVLHALRRLP
jgi:AcrR family transcriptional regulator